jgi:hypothetical protein
MWLGRKTNVCTKLSRSALNLCPTISLRCRLQKSQKSSASMICLWNPLVSTIQHCNSPLSIHYCTSSARTCSPSARACFVHQSWPIREPAPSRCNMDAHRCRRAPEQHCDFSHGRRCYQVEQFLFFGFCPLPVASLRGQPRLPHEPPPGTSRISRHCGDSGDQRLQTDLRAMLVLPRQCGRN